MNNSKYNASFIIITAIVWAAVTISVVAMAIYAGVTGIVFAFVVLIVAVTSWSRVVREKGRTEPDVDKAIDALNKQIQLLSDKIEELRKELQA
ncbi:MAG: hypothetical protein RXR16_03315 [Thermocladium sp.]|nr:MAG: hypothetical protein AT710_02785 [Thermocladium sp. ECH_B]